MRFRIGILLIVGSTKHCFRNDEGAEPFWAWKLASKSLSLEQNKIHVKIDILVCKISQGLIFLS